MNQRENEAWDKRKLKKAALAGDGHTSDRRQHLTDQPGGFAPDDEPPLVT